MQSQKLTRRHLLGEAAAAISTALWVGASADQTRSAPTEGPVRSLRAKVGNAPGAAPNVIWGFEGEVPGPVVRVRRGEELRLRVVNELPEPTVVHWHGVRLPNPMDGVASLTQPPIAPGASFEYRFRPPDAGTYWYRAQREGSVLTHTLYGVLIVEEPEPIDLEREALLVLDDWRLRAGSLDREGLPDADRRKLNSHLIINGHPAADILVKTNERLRLRVLNAAMDRMFSLRIERHRVMVMGVDGQPAEPFQARDGRVTLGPGNRLDLFLDATLASGEEATLFVEDGQTQGSIGRLIYMDGEPVRPAPRETSPPLPANELPARMAFQTALRLDLRLEHLSDPQQALPEVGAPAPIALFSAKRGRTVMLALRNGTLAPHMVHLHGHYFRLLDRLDDGWKPYWLDTITLAPGQTSRIAFIADNPGKWLIESRRLEARRPLTAAWFAVT